MSKVYIIAEAGVNHNGDLKAKKLVQEAKKANADAEIKFQYYKTENLVLKKHLKQSIKKTKKNLKINLIC